MDFFFQIFSLFEQTPNELNQKLFENEEFKEQFKKIIKSRPNLARAKRGEMYTPEYVPGPEYNINIYSFNSTEEINQIFTDRKSRFNKKIFTNKKGPLLYLDKSEKFSLEKEKEKEQDKNIINMDEINRRRLIEAHWHNKKQNVNYYAEIKIICQDIALFMI